MDINSIITEEEYNKVKALSYKEFSEIMSKVVKLCVEESLRSLPSVMTHLSSQAAYLQALSDKFYKDNKDLIPHKKIVAQNIENIEGNNPGISYEEVLKKAAVNARKVISSINVVPNTNNIKNLEVEKFDSHLGKL